jgi:PAS domain S-box-containing protein
LKTDLSILIVEDERIVAEDIRAILEQAGYKVAGIAGSGEMAIEYTRTLHPDLILMDIFLSSPMTGIEAAVKIKEACDIPLIFLTAYSDAQYIEKAKLTGPYGYILKPFDEKDLISSIEIAVYKHDLDTKLRESEERYRIFVEHFLGIAFRMHPDLTPVFYHGAVQQITGYSEPDLLSGTPSFVEIIHPDDLPHVQETIRLAMEEPGSPKALEFRIVRKDGTLCWIYELLQVFPGPEPFIQGACYDITERKEAEELIRSVNEELERRVFERTRSLNNQLQFLQQLIDTIPSPVFYKDTKGQYIGCNKSFETYWGLHKREIIGRKDTDLLPPDLAGAAVERDAILLENRGIQAYTSSFRHADGTLRNVIVKRATFNDLSGTISGFIGVIQDITELIRAEDALKAREQLLREVVQDQTDLIVRYRPDWTILFANNAFLSYFGRTEEDTIGHIFRPKIVPEDEMTVLRHYKNFGKERTISAIDCRVELQHGAVKKLHWTTRAFLDEHGNISEFQSTCREISDPGIRPGS